MKHPFVVSRNNISWAGSLGLMIGGVFLMAVVSSGIAQAPQGPKPGGPGQQQGPPPTPPTAGAHLEIMDGSASYQVTEQFVGINFPSDAVGASTTVAGTLVIAPDGSIPPGSKLTIDLRNLKSDQEQRDNFIKTRTLETDKYPLAEFLTGNLTVHGVTKEVTFQGIATFGRDSTVAGRAKTSFTFATFGLTKPSIGRLMSVDDKIDLDLTFKFKRT
jgi:polyisoprenoid-binding protein YceI